MAKTKRARGYGRSYKRSTRSKLRRKWQRKRFVRMLNSVAEKKVRTIVGAQPSLIYNHPNADPGLALIADSLPQIGTGNNQRIGSKIFVRYVILEVFYANLYPPMAELSGLVSQFIGKERFAYSTGLLSPNDITGSYNGHPCLNPYMLKQPLRKMKLYHKRIYPNSRRVADGSDGINNLQVITNHGVHTNAFVWRKKFKIMRSVTINVVAALPRLDCPDIIWFPVHWDPAYTVAIGNPTYSFRLTMSFTDV